MPDFAAQFHSLGGDFILTILEAAAVLVSAIAGMIVAANKRMDIVGAYALAVVNAFGGGTVRDLLLAEVPSVLRKDVYASAALAGGVVMVVLLKVQVPRAVAMLTGGGACFLLRMVAVARGWNLPRLLHH